MPSVVVVPYDPAWPAAFEVLRTQLWAQVGDFADSIEHVGSTSVPGLAAKPILDIDIVVPGEADLDRVTERLGPLGYACLGTLGIAGRVAYRLAGAVPAHNLYACPRDSEGLRNHLSLRDTLRRSPDLARAYGDLKLDLARHFPDDIDGYVDGKTDFIVRLLRDGGIDAEALASITKANRKPS